MDLMNSYYDYWWENPRDVRSPIFRRLNEEVFEALRGTRGRHALDIGSGKGTIVRLLRSLGFAVTAVESNPLFARRLEDLMPEVTVVCADVRKWNPVHTYEIATCIEVAQVLSHDDLRDLLRRIRPRVGRILLNISNMWSLHGTWVRVRGFQAPFIVNYTPRDLRRIVTDSGYDIVQELGVGFVTPITMWKDFHGVIIGERTAHVFASLDTAFPRQCHLYLVDALSPPA